MTHMIQGEGKKKSPGKLLLSSLQGWIYIYVCISSYIKGMAGEENLSYFTQDIFPPKINYYYVRIE